MQETFERVADHFIGVNIRRPLANGGQNFMASLLTGAVSDASSRLEVMK
jgi:hypothetical protein